MAGEGATVVVPTTAGRGALLRWSVGSALSQTVEDIEVFIVGDGMLSDDIAEAERLMAADPRVRLFEFPKDERRGERHRHEILSAEANGEIVAYLTDRDLWRPHHIAELRRLLAGADLAHTLRCGIGPSEEIEVIWRSELDQPGPRRRAHEASTLIPLSFGGHTMDAYRRLPHGWRTTPSDQPTDRYMWQQFLDQPWCRVAAGARPTVLYFKRGSHPGLAVAERRALLEDWSARAEEPGFDEWWQERATKALLLDRSALVDRLADRLIDRLRRRTPTAVQSALASVVPSGAVAAMRQRLDASRLS